jgi:hypothetical protein
MVKPSRARDVKSVKHCHCARLGQQKPAWSGRLPAGFVSMLTIGIGSSTDQTTKPVLTDSR